MSSDQLSADIRAAMASIPPGEKIRIVCPFCAAAHEHSFEVRRMTEKTHLLRFQCWRGTCARTGYVVDTAGAGMVLSPSDTAAEVLPLTIRDHPTQEFLESIAGAYNMTTAYLQSQGVREGPGAALCMPWRDADGQQVGWVEKRFDHRYHKSHHELTDKRAPRLGFPARAFSYWSAPEDMVCVLVESLVDAYRVNSYAVLVGAHRELTAVALLGADISRVDALHLTLLFKRIMVCLDYDQWPKGAMRVMNRFKAMPVTVRATTLHDDPKDASDADLEELMERCRELHDA